MKRRTFILSAASAARAARANEKIRGAVIGSGGRGRLLTGVFKEVGVEMAAVCDVYEANLQAGLKAASTGAKAYDNYKRMLEDKSIDVVIVATPDHWHAQMSIDAVEAGKEVYVEKPMAHTPEEGFRMIEAVRRTKRILQVGTQRRSSELFMSARDLVRGQLGSVHLVNSWWVNYQDTLRSRELQGKLDWHEWLGSAPQRPLDPKIFFNWYWFWDYSGGLLVGQAAHIIDCIQWFMNSTFPTAVTAAAGRNNVGGEVPETASMSAEYPENYLAVFTLGYKAMRYHTYNDQMKHFHGTKARLDVAREAYWLYPQSAAIEMKPTITVTKPGSFNFATQAHVQNFLECVRSRKDPTAPVEAGQHTNVALCMAVESIRTGKRVRWNQAAKRMEG